MNWAQQFNTFCFLDNHQYQIKPHTQECLLAAGIKGSSFTGAGITQLQEYLKEKQNRWLFGHLSYDLKNGLEALSSHHHDHIQFPEIFFFEPSVLISLNEHFITIQADDPRQIFNEINAIILKDPASKPVRDIRINNRIQKEEYLSIIQKLRRHILRGDCYEINFCQEFFSEAVDVDPLSLYKRSE